MTFTKDLELRSFVSTHIYDLGDPPTHKYFDYHWIGGVTETTATIKITLLPNDQTTDWYYSIEINDPKTSQTRSRSKGLESLSAISRTATDLKADTEYEVVYTLYDQDYAMVEQR